MICGNCTRNCSKRRSSRPPPTAHERVSLSLDAARPSARSLRLCNGGELPPVAARRTEKRGREPNSDTGYPNATPGPFFDRPPTPFFVYHGLGSQEPSCQGSHSAPVSLKGCPH